jgi:integrase
MPRGQTPKIRWNELEQAWTCKVTFPDGHRERVCRKDKVDAQRDLDEKLARRASQTADVRHDDPKLTTFDQVVEAWIEAGCPRVSVASGGGRVRRHHTTRGETTIDQISDYLRGSVTRPADRKKCWHQYPNTARTKAAIGSLWVDRTTTERVERVFAAMDEDGLATSTIHKTWQHLNDALAWSQKRRLTKSNPVADAMLPAQKPGRDVRSLTTETARVLFDHLPLENERLAPLWLTALMVGCRPGEILGIRWPWLDLESETPTFAIEERAHERRGVYQGQAAPKVESFRTIMLHPLNVAALVKHRDNLIALGRYDPNGFVFPTKTGKPQSQTNTRKYFKRFCIAAGLDGDGWTTNSLRHSFATIGDELLDERTHVGKVMGHRHEATTAGYIHKTEERPVIEHAVDVWNTFLSRAS